jgi:hypothetical protein
LFASAVEGGEKDGYEQCDNSDDNEKLDERESPRVGPTVVSTLHVLLLYRTAICGS